MSKVAEKSGVHLRVNLHDPNRMQSRVLRLRIRGVTERKMHLPLVIIVPNSVYLAVGDSTEFGLKMGQVLIRNKDLQRRLGWKDAPYDEQMFVRYDNLFDAFRAMSRLNPTYEAVEIPTMEALLVESDELTKISWTREVRTENGRLAYRARAWKAMELITFAENEHKENALDQLTRASHVKDKRGRINPTRLGLMLLTVDLELVARIEEARNIGHRMTHRAMKLQMNIDAYDHAINTMRLDLEHLLRENGVFGTGCTPDAVRYKVKTVRASLPPLSFLSARPYVHVVKNFKLDMMTAATSMEDAVDEWDSTKSWDPLKLAHAKMYVHRAYRSLVQLQKMRLIHEVLATVAAFHYRKELPDASQVNDLCRMIHSIRTDLTSLEPFTHEPLEQGFRNPIQDRVVPQLNLAFNCLSDLEKDGVKKLRQARLHLKKAVKPL